MVSPPLLFSIRKYRDGDAPVMAQLFYSSVHNLGLRRYTPEQVAVWAPEPPGATHARAIHARALDGRTTLVAINGSEEIVAYGDMEGNGHIDHLYCRPDVAGAGVASQLLDRLLAIAMSAGMSRLYVEASELARSLFERKGFRIVRRHDFELHGVLIHNYVMERSLAQTKEDRRRLTLEALADVDAGRVVDQQAVLDWAASLDGLEALRSAPARGPLNPQRKSRR